MHQKPPPCVSYTSSHWSDVPVSVCQLSTPNKVQTEYTHGRNTTEATMNEGRTLKCLMWNARGLATRQCRKLEERVIASLFEEYDIIGHNSPRRPVRRRFVHFHNPRHQERTNEGKKNYGGVVVYA